MPQARTGTRPGVTPTRAEDASNDGDTVPVIRGLQPPIERTARSQNGKRRGILLSGLRVSARNRRRRHEEERCPERRMVCAPVLFVADTLDFYVNRLGFTRSWQSHPIAGACVIDRRARRRCATAGMSEFLILRAGRRARDHNARGELASPAKSRRSARSTRLTAAAARACF
jgi:hypothetical protein